MSDAPAKSAVSSPKRSESATSSQSPTEIYAVVGVEPEINAYAMAKYSRSALSMRESLREMDGQKAEKFLNTFYFQYGHRSIADLAHISFAVERLSILAAIEVADESKWDGQERSTRYQPFKKTGWITPASLKGELRQQFERAAGRLFEEYTGFTTQLLDYLKTQVPCPADMATDAYERTLRARAFDVSRYLLPLATATSLGQIVSARTLEQQIVRLVASPYEEVRGVGEALRRAASEPAHNLQQERAERVLRALEHSPEVSAAVLADAQALAQPVRVAPTLVKYTEPNAYAAETRAELRQAAEELLKEITPANHTRVDLTPPVPLDCEVAASLLYPLCHHSYRQIGEVLSGLPAARVTELVEMGLRRRGRHDELLREFQAGQPFQFDILMDIGGFRDLHRHRRCVQLHQAYTFEHGPEAPEMLGACGLLPRYEQAMREARSAAAALPKDAAPYLMPLAFRRRSLFKMDLAQVIYIIETRSTPAGHFSYREAAWEMYEALRREHPAAARFVRVSDPRQPVDPLQR